jgi:hypothetical protein
LREFQSPPPTNKSGANTGASRITVSKFLFKPTDPAKPNAGYEIDLYMVNKGNIPGRAPTSTVAFNTVDGLMSPADVDAEMAKVVQLATEKPPPTSEDRVEIDVGVEGWQTLPRGVTEDARKAIASGEKRFYLFVALTYSDNTLAAGQYWLSEFCASQSKDFSNFQLCSGHNRTRLHT